MTWSTRFRLRLWLRGSLWALPLAGAIAGAVLGALGDTIGQDAVISGRWSYSPATATAVLSAIVGATAALAGFVVTVSVLVVQMVTGAFSPRYMRLWYRDPFLKATLALLAGTMAYSFQLLRNVEPGSVPNVGVAVAGLLLLVGLILFLLFLDRFIQRLRPVAVASLVARAGRRAFQDEVEDAAHADTPDVGRRGYRPGREPSVVVRAARAGAIQAVDGSGLVRWARTHGCLVVLPNVVGDFVSNGAPLVEVYGDAPADTERHLRGLVALGDERTIEQDHTFAIRIMVDVAARALSPAVNDPTTAVQVLNHLADLLRLVGTTPWPERGRDPGNGSVVVRTRTWDETLALGLTEIREFGASSIQVPRRMRAVLEDLHVSVLPEHRAAVEDELARLEATVADTWAATPDLDRAGRPDRQGIGGSAGSAP